MEKHGSCRFGKVSNASFSYSVLVMRIYPTEGDGLMSAINRVAKFLSGEDTVIGMVMFHGDVMFSCELFECLFCVNGVVCAIFGVKMNIIQTGRVIDKNRRVPVSLLGEFSCYLRDKTWCL